MSTPYDPEARPSHPALEPTDVQRRLPPAALSELVRLVDAVERELRDDEYQAVAAPAAETSSPPSAAEATPPPAKDEGTQPASTPGAKGIAWTTEDATRALPPVTGEERPGPPEPRAAYGRTPWVRRAALAVAALAIALAGFGAALLLTWDRGATESQAEPPAPSAPAAPPATGDPDGPGTLRQGYSGPEVRELQERLLKIPDVYRDGGTSGEYDAELTEAVARFQLWYGIRGDETGVYGNDTRRDLESRTAS